MMSRVSNRFLARLSRPIRLATLGALAALWLTAPTLAQTRLVPEPASRPAAVSLSELHAGQMAVPVHKSQVLRLNRPFSGLSVGNPEIADVVPLTDRSVYVLGKALGTTNLTIYGPNKSLVAVVDLVVSHDVEGLKAKLHEVLPNERIEVRPGNSSIILRGVVSSPEAASQAMQVAARYAPEKVTNLLRVQGSQQVMLSVRIAEVSRVVAKELGIKPFLQAGDAFAFATLDNIDTLGIDLTRFGAAELFTQWGDLTLDVLIDALEEKGLLKILAEPNLIAMSGETASFLAGGEFPIPVAQDTEAGAVTITVEFKQFGVSLAFTPTVLDGNDINLLVAPEVSQIDPTTAVSFNGFSIPGISTRRANTTVQLRDGQSFAIAGLLQSDMQNEVRQLPGLGNVPILGALFRSSEFLRRETELVIIVTPHLVKPAAPGQLLMPTDYFVPPSDLDIFLEGRVSGPDRPIARPSAAATALGNNAGGGIAGLHGYIIK